MASPNGQRGSGLSVRTLVIASLASLTAAILTRQLFPAGTVYASALTPVIVAAVSEALHRPANRVAALREQRRTLVREARESQVSRVLGEEANPLRGAPEFAQGAEGIEEPATVANGHVAGRDPLAGVSIHGRRRRRVMHPKVWVATGVAAFAIAAAALTLPELIFGGAVAAHDRTTLFGGGGSSHHTSTAPTQTQTTTTSTTPTQTVTTVTETTPTSTTGTAPSTTTTTSTTTTNGGSTAPAPTGTGTSTGGIPTP